MSSLKPNTLERQGISDEYKWNLSDIYQSWDEWEKDLALVEVKAQELIQLKGQLAGSAEMVEKAYRLSDTIGERISKVRAFTHLHFDLDQRNDEVNALQQRVRIVGSKISVGLSWLTPELLTIPWETMESWIEKNEYLQLHKFPISELYRSQIHVLNEDGERLLSYSSRLTGSPSTAYEMLSTADVVWPVVKLSSGEERIATPSSYAESLDSLRSQEDRRAMFEAHFNVYKANQNTYAALYGAICHKDWYITRARKYKDTLDIALEDDAIPTELFTNLIETTRKGVKPLQRYHHLRKNFLKLDKYDLYDGLISLVDVNRKYPYNSVKDLILESVAPLGNEYQEKVARAFQGGWIDVYENNGKRSGAYSAGVYGVHPFMLMNYNDTLDQMFTLAHEMGHSIHTLYSQENQPYPTAAYTIFVAEVASTLNEALLLEHLLKLTEDPRERIVLLEHSIKNILATYYTQVRFADFEREAHRLVETDKPVTANILSELMYSGLRDYHGDAAELHELYKLTWARIPHFYRTPYYVYKYATSFAASAALAINIIPGKSGIDEQGRQAAVDRYLNMLKSGGNKFPLDQLKGAGVDLLSPEPINTVISTLDIRITQLEEALADLQPN